MSIKFVFFLLKSLTQSVITIVYQDIWNNFLFFFSIYHNSQGEGLVWYVWFEKKAYFLGLRFNITKYSRNLRNAASNILW